MTTTFIKTGRKYATQDLRFIVSRERDGWFMLDRTTRNEYFLTPTRDGAIEEASRQVEEIIASESEEEVTMVRTIPADMIWTHKHDHEYGSLASCQCCGRPVSRNAVGSVVGDGGSSIVHPDDAASIITDGGYMGWYPIGSECAKKIPAEYLTR